MRRWATAVAVLGTLAVFGVGFYALMSWLMTPCGGAR